MSPSESASEPELCKLLPWYENQILGEPERERVIARLQVSPAAREQAAFLRFLRSSLHQIEAPPPTTELEKRRIRRAARSERWRAFLPHALIATLALAALQGAWLWNLHGQLAAARAYHPAAAPSPAQLTVRFADGATERAIREQLVQHPLLIVDGPSAGGSYGLALVEPGSDLRAVLRALRASSQLVSFAGAR